MSAKLFDSSFDVLQKSLDMHLLRHAVIADNIANAETPGFKARRVDFEAELQKAVEHGEGQDDHVVTNSVLGLKPNIYDDPLSETGQDHNSVDMDREMASMTKNDTQYSAATQAVTKKFALLKYAISEGDR